MADIMAIYHKYFSFIMSMKYLTENKKTPKNVIENDF